VALLALRYRRTDGTQRGQIRWLLFGIGASLSLWIPAGALWQLADPDSTAAGVASELLSGLAEVTTLGSVLGALFYTGVFGIDEPARRAFVHRVLRVSIGVVLAVLAVLAGMITSLAAPVAVAVAVAVAAGQRARPFGPVWNTSPIAGCSAHGLSAEQLSHRRVTAVLTFLRDAGLRG
jgi:hypothetical protein